VTIVALMVVISIRSYGSMLISTVAVVILVVIVTRRRGTAGPAGGRGLLE